MNSDGTLRKLNPKDGWLAERFHSDMMGTDGADKGKMPEQASASRPLPAPYYIYKGDKHDAFWYFDQKMAEMTEARYLETAGKKVQYVGFEHEGKLVPYDEKSQGGMKLDLQDMEGITFHIKAVYTDSSHGKSALEHGKKKPHIEVINGPVKKINDTTFRFYPYEAGWDNARRSFTCWLVAVADADKEYKGAVQPIRIDIPKDVMERLR